MGIFADQFEEMYKMDYQFGWMDKAGLRGVVGQGFLSPEGYERITGDKYDSENSEQA